MDTYGGLCREAQVNGSGNTVITPSSCGRRGFLSYKIRVSNSTSAAADGSMGVAGLAVRFGCK